MQDISRAKFKELENTLYACYVDGGDPNTLVDHAMNHLGITVEGKALPMQCNSEDHVPGGRIYVQETRVAPEEFIIDWDNSFSWGFWV